MVDIVSLVIVSNEKENILTSKLASEQVHTFQRWFVDCSGNGLCEPWSLAVQALPVTSTGCYCAPAFAGPLCEHAVSTVALTTTPPLTTTATPLPTTSTPATTSNANQTMTTTTADPIGTGTALNLACPNGCSGNGQVSSFNSTFYTEIYVL